MKKPYFLHEATPTWAGYNHQGSCGLLVAISKMTKIISILKDNHMDYSSLKQYSIEYEGMEDFSIKRADEYIEIHQVKNYQKTGFGDYKEAIWLLLAKKDYIKTIEATYLHLTHEINHLSADNNTQLFETFKSYAPPSEISESQRNNLYYTPRECYEYFKNKYEQDGYCNDISDAYKSNFEKFKIYKYRDDYFCTDTEISNKVKMLINEFLVIIRETRISQARINRVYYALKAKLVENISKRNEVLKNKDLDNEHYKNEINFFDLYELLRENLDSMSLEAFVNREKENLNEAVEDYYFDRGKSIESREAYDKLKEIIGKINLFDTEDLIRQIKFMNPHISINETDTSSFTLPNVENLKITILNIFAQIKNKIDFENIIYIAGEDTYKPTTIQSSFHSSIVRDILKNKDKEMFAAYKYYITNELTYDINNDPNVTKAPDSDVRDGENTNINKKRLPRLINLDEAKEILN